MYIVWKLDEIFCRHQLGTFDLWCGLVLEFLYWLFVWLTYLLVMGGIKLSHYHSIGVYRSFRVCLMKLHILMLGPYRLIIVISFCCISPFVSMECKDTLHCVLFNQCTLEVCIVSDKYCYSCLFSGTTGLVNLLWAFHPKPVLVSVNEMGLL
jgi:hypothetical protein